MTPNIERLTPNGEIRSADLIASIAKHLRMMASLPNDGHTRPEALRRYAERLSKLAIALEVRP